MMRNIYGTLCCKKSEPSSPHSHSSFTTQMSMSSIPPSAYCQDEILSPCSPRSVADIEINIIAEDKKIPEYIAQSPPSLSTVLTNDKSSFGIRVYKQIKDNFLFFRAPPEPLGKWDTTKLYLKRLSTTTLSIYGAMQIFLNVTYVSETNMVSDVLDEFTWKHQAVMTGATVYAFFTLYYSQKSALVDINANNIYRLQTIVTGLKAKIAKLKNYLIKKEIEQIESKKEENHLMQIQLDARKYEAENELKKVAAGLKREFAEELKAINETHIVKFNYITSELNFFKQEVAKFFNEKSPLKKKKIKLEKVENQLTPRPTPPPLAPLNIEEIEPSTPTLFC